MNIVVCLKQVPATTEVKIDPQTNTLVREGIKNVVNPYDTYALEEAIRLKERYGGMVTVISMGPPQAEQVLREAIASGADQAYLLSDRAFAGADTLATSYTLSLAITLQIKQCDLVICGRQSIDGDTGQVSPQLAQTLGFSFVSYVDNIEDISAGKMRARRMIDEGHEIVETSLPAVISVVKGINVPRLPSLRGIMRAKNAVIPVLNAQQLDADPHMIGLTGSATKVVRI
ncbi:MAG: electron transfer flavoprotein subunit beta/FixA family protein, partial [Dehalococcoidales bacterium]|nr:electron transfer flavoprotein subunit beta/FixA family protein [Dehalococcoidales bacterium]